MMNKKYFIWIICISLIGFVLFKFYGEQSTLDSFLLSFGLGIWSLIFLSIYLYFKVGFNSNLVRWVFWIIFLGSFYALFNYLKEEHGFGVSLSLYIVLMIAIGLLYFFVINPIAKHLDKNKNTEDKINELEKRIDEIDKD